MAEHVCEQCGERNPAGRSFCASCGAFLAWEDEQSDTSRTPSDAGGQAAGASGGGEPLREEGVTTVLRPPDQGQSSQGQSVQVEAPPEDTTEARFAVLVETSEVTVGVLGEPATFAVRVTNTSDIVEGYVVEPVGAPGWLTAKSSEVRLLPGTDEPVSVEFRVSSGTLVPAQQVTVVLRLHAVSRPSAHFDVGVFVTVPVLDVPVQLRAEPRLLRIRDAESGECTLVVDNVRSNRGVQVRFTGSDPELAVRFRFEPPVLEVGPGASGSARVVFTAPGPEPGQDISRSLTVIASDGDRSAETLVTVQQSTSARTEDPPVTLDLEPSLVRVRDGTVGLTRVTADNRGGTEWAHLRFSAADPERLVRVSWSQPQLDVPPGRTAQVEVRFEAPPPEPGSEVSRTVTITGTDGRRTSTATATFVIAASASPITTLAVRIEPAVMRVRDIDDATVQVVLDNRRGRSGVRLGLDGRDPERAVRFTFSSPVVDVGPGQVQTVALRLDALRPDPGQEVTRQLSVTASDGRTSVEGSGSLVQTSSRAAIELLTVGLDPSVLRLAGRRRGSLSAVVDNRNGAQPIRVSMTGDDPENVVRFAFAPPVLDVAPGRMARTAVTVRAPRAPSRQEVTRPFMIAASDGRSAVRTEGTLLQSGGDRRPLARALFTVLGGLAMIFGALQSWVAGRNQSGIDLTASRLGRAFGVDLDLAGFEDVVSAGLVVVGLAVLVIFGLTGRKGRLSRLAAALGILFVIALFVALNLVGINIAPGPGAVLVILGCIAGYIGGKLIPR